METSQLSRGQFLKQLGMSSAALMSFYCLGTTLTSCSKDEPEPTPTPIPPGTLSPSTPASSGITGVTTGTAIDFTLDLTNANFRTLKTEGQFTYVGDIIIVNAKGTFAALSKVCTHVGTTVEFRSSTNDLRCPNHGSEFKLDGSVQRSPADSGLKVFKTELLNSGNSLKITA